MEPIITAAALGAGATAATSLVYRIGRARGKHSVDTVDVETDLQQLDDYEPLSSRTLPKKEVTRVDKPLVGFKKVQIPVSEVPEQYRNSQGHVVTDTHDALRSGWRTVDGIARVVVPKGVRVYSEGDAPSDKHRTEALYVDKIHVLEGAFGNPTRSGGRQSELGERIDAAVGDRNDDFEYHMGTMAVPEEPFDDESDGACASGVHFFRDVGAAMEW